MACQSWTVKSVAVTTRVPSRLNAAYRTVSACSRLVAPGPSSSQTRIVFPPLVTVTSRRPSSLNAAWWTVSSCTSGGVTGLPVATSHTRAVWSVPAVTSRVLSGLNATEMGSPSSRIDSPSVSVFRSHRIAHPPRVPIATQRPSGLKAARSTQA